MWGRFCVNAVESGQAADGAYEKKKHGLPGRSPQQLAAAKTMAASHDTPANEQAHLLFQREL